MQLDKIFTQLNDLLPNWWILVIGAIVGVVMYFVNKRALQKLGEDKAKLLESQIRNKTSKYVKIFFWMPIWMIIAVSLVIIFVFITR